MLPYWLVGLYIYRLTNEFILSLVHTQPITSSMNISRRRNSNSGDGSNASTIKVVEGESETGFVACEEGSFIPTVQEVDLGIVNEILFKSAVT